MKQYMVYVVVCFLFFQCSSRVYQLDQVEIFPLFVKQCSILPDGSQEQLRCSHDAVMVYVLDHFQYPRILSTTSPPQGLLLIEMVITKRGMVKKADIVSGIDPLIDTEMVRVIESMPCWERPAERSVIFLFGIQFGVYHEYEQRS